MPVLVGVGVLVTVADASGISEGNTVLVSEGRNVSGLREEIVGIAV